MNAFALLDMGKPGVPLGPFHPKDCFIASRGLFEGGPEARLTTKGPWLATMEMRYGFDYRAYVERELVPHGAAIWLDTPLSFDATFRHLRQFMQVRLPDGGTALLRFWDGSVFQRLTYVPQPAQYAALVAPFSRWETTATQGVCFKGGPVTIDDDFGIELPLTLTAHQMAMLSLPMVERVARKLTREIWHGNPKARAGMEPAVVLDAVQRAYRFALENLRLSDLGAIAAWVKADAGWAPGLHRRPGLDRRIRESAQPDLSVEDILSAIKAAARFKESR